MSRNILFFLKLFNYILKRYVKDYNQKNNKYQVFCLKIKQKSGLDHFWDFIKIKLI